MLPGLNLRPWCIQIGVLTSGRFGVSAHAQMSLKARKYGANDESSEAEGSANSRIGVMPVAVLRVLISSDFGLPLVSQQFEQTQPMVRQFPMATPLGD